MKKCILLLFVLIQVSAFTAEALHQTTAYWDGECFSETTDRNINKKKSRVIEGTSIYFSANHITCYGHALLDGVFPLYCMLKEHGLMNAPVNLLIKADRGTQNNKTFSNIIHLLSDVFSFKEIIVLKPGDCCKRLVVDEHVPFKAKPFKYFAFYRAYPESFQYIHHLNSLGFCDNLVFKDTQNENNIFVEFVAFIKNAYKIDLPIVKNRMLIANRSFGRKIVNLDSLVSSLKGYGYDVVVVDFEKLSIQQQIIEASQSEYLLGTYGSNLVNAVFLQPGANVVILWHKYAKYFWSRRYCIIHSAFLSAGAKLIEYDQPQYDTRNVYSEAIHAPDYFFRAGRMNILYPEKISMDAIVNYPLPAMYEITNVDLFIDPFDLFNCLKRSENF